MQHRYWLVSVLILLFTLWLRLSDLDSFPVFVDEGTYILWAKFFAANTPTYPILMEGRLLAVVVMSLFDLSGAGPLWLARAAVAITSVINGAACLALGRMAGAAHGSSPPWMGWLAAMLYAVLPYALFHDRQAITDPLATAFGSVVLVSAVQLARTRRWRWSMTLAVALATAVLAKFTGGLYLALFAAAVIIWPRRRMLAAQYLAALGLAALVAGLILLALWPRLGTTGGILADSELSPLQCPPALCRGDWNEQARRLPVALTSLPGVVSPYIGWPIIALAVFGWVVGAARETLPGEAIRRKGRAKLTWTLGALVVAVLIIIIVTMRAVVVPRYLGFLIVPLLVLAAQGLAFWLRPRGEMALAAFAVVLGLSLGNSYTLLTAPAQAELPAIDQRQYLTGPYSGVGFREVAQAIVTQETDPQRPPLILAATSWHILPLGAYLDARVMRALAAPETTWPEVQAAFVQERAVYLLDELPPEAPAEAPHNLLVLPRQGEAKTLRLRRFMEPDADALRALFHALFPRPDGFLEAYDQLLSETPPGALLLAHPNHQAALLQERPAAAEKVVLTASEPWDSESLVRALPAQPGLVRAIFFDEARLDPEREVETWLVTHLFHVDARWYGPLRVVDFVGADDADGAHTWTPEARFGDAIQLDTVELLDAAPRPGEPLRLRLAFRAVAPTQVPYKVFAHFFQGERLLAQHDGQPAGDLRPTTGWRPGDVIHDQIALRLPGDLSPGKYAIRIGLYSAETQERLPAMLPDGQSAEFVTLGAVTVK